MKKGKGLKVGDLVTLRSGGPTMVVQGVENCIENNEYVRMITCRWIADDGRAAFRDQFHEALLTQVDSKGRERK